MNTTGINIKNNEWSVTSKLSAFIELMKPRLILLVSFSSAFGYLLGTVGVFNWEVFLMFILGGLLVSGSSVSINQIIEKDLDGKMNRTRNRPLPTGRLKENEAWVFSILIGATGLWLLWIYTNPLTAFLSALSLVLYAFVYTPLKRKGPIAVFVGAIPGALPPLLGWVAASGIIGYEALIIFGIQFIWQFPHFWAIAWVADDDYKKAGFKLLPSGGGKTMNTAFQIMIYTLFLLPLGLLPAKFGLTGINSAMIATVCGSFFLAQTFYLMKTGTDLAAKKIMYLSFLYLPIVQVAFVLDKV